MKDEIIYDTGALVAGERRGGSFTLLHRELIAAGIVPIVPAPVLAQAWRGGSQPMLSRLLRSCQVLSMTEDAARGAGAACAASGTKDVVDATVVVVAVMVGAASIVTSDPDDLNAISRSIGCRIPMRRV